MGDLPFPSAKRVGRRDERVESPRCCHAVNDNDHGRASLPLRSICTYQQNSCNTFSPAEDEFGAGMSRRVQRKRAIERPAHGRLRDCGGVKHLLRWPSPVAMLRTAPALALLGVKPRPCTWRRRLRRTIRRQYVGAIPNDCRHVAERPFSLARERRASDVGGNSIAFFHGKTSIFLTRRPRRRRGWAAPKNLPIGGLQQVRLGRSTIAATLARDARRIASATFDVFQFRACADCRTTAADAVARGFDRRFAPA